MKRTVPALIVATLLCVFATVAFAGSLSPATSPAAVGYTLADIYNRLVTNASAIAGSYVFTTASSPAASFYTLTQIYEAIPTIDPTKVLFGTTYLGVAGTIPTNTLSASTGALEAGYYAATTLSAIDADLAAAKIKNNVNIFGLTGSYIGYPGTGWVPGNGGSVITQATCDAASDGSWKWFNDGNGDGDTTDPEDGVCVRTATVTSDSWNGAEQMNLYTLGDTTATGGAANSVTVSSANWPVNKYVNEIIKITSGTASGCWGLVKSNTATTVTVYNSWTTSGYAGSCGTPDATSHFQIYDDNKYDNSWIGDYSCTGNFPTGSVVLGSYPASGTLAIAVADCYDGKRDVLPNEADRAVLSGTVTSTSTVTVAGDTITDSALTAGMVDANAWMGQKLLITGGTGAGTYGTIEKNTTNSFTVGSWSGTAPDTTSTYSIIYLIPRTAYVGGTGMSQFINGSTGDDAKQGNGPLTTEVLKAWRGTRLPTALDFFGFCGYKDGGSNYENTSNVLSANKIYGNYGDQVGRTDEFMDLANSGSWEWLSEPHYYYSARIAGGNACSYFNGHSVYNSYRFRSVLRP